MEKILKILFVEDVLRDAELIWHELEKSKILFEKLLVDKKRDYLKALRNFNPDIIISDYSMPQFDGMTALLLRNEHSPLTPFILVTGSINEEVAVECMKAGAEDYILKDKLTRLGTALNNAVNKMELLKQKNIAEAALRESEERFRILYNDAVVGLYRTNLQGKIFLANTTLLNMLGFQSFEELASRNLKEAGYGPSYLRQEFVDQIEKEGEIKDLEAIWICRDGTEIFVRESARAIYRSDGEILYYDGTVQNISEQKRAAEELRKVQHLFETLATVSPVGIFRTGPDGRTTYVNPRWLELTGSTFEEAMGFRWMDVVHPDDRTKLKERWESNVKSQEASVDEYRFLRKDGNIIWVMGNAVPEWLDDEIVGYVGTITDITERKQAEEALVESETKYRQLVTRSPDGIFIVDLSGRFLSVNSTICENLKYTEKELLSMNIWSIVPEKYHALNKQRLTVIMNGGSINVGAEYEVIGKDGIAHPVEVLSVPYYQGNKIIGFQGIARDIAERKKTEKILRESEEKFRRIFENVQDVYYETTMDGTILEVSHSIGFLSNGQYHREDLVGKSMYEFYSFSEERQLLMKVLKEKGSITDFEIKLRNRDGSIIPCSISSKINYDALGQPVNIIGSLRNVSERKRAQEALVQSELRFKQISEYSGEWIWEVDKNGLYTYSSQIVKEILGYEPEEIVNKKYFYDFFNPAVKEQFKKIAMEAFSRKENFRDFENSNLHKDGREVILSTSGLAVLDSSGNLVSYLGVDRDITEPKRVEEVLRKSQQIIEGILDAIPVRVFWKDENLVYLGCNSIFARDAGFDDPKDIIGKNDYQMGWHDQAELYRADDQQVVDSGLPKLFIEESQTTPEGNSITLLTSKIPLLGPKGEISGVLGTYIDITDRKKAEVSLKQALEKAEESDRLKTAFLHNISHEIRTPMNAIVGFSALLGEPDNDIETRRSYIELIMQSSNHLLAIISDIVDISNIEANLVKNVKNEISINSALKSICNLFTPQANEKNIILTCEPGLPDSDAFIMTDNTKLTQILSNLIANALKFTDEGNINVGYKLKESFLEFSVSDTGIGIPREYHDKIFNRFYQVQNTISRIYEGTGLGLAISKAYAELLGGSIWLVSKPRNGTTFYFTIPYEKSASSVDIRQEDKVPEKLALIRKKTILIAEDIESNFKLLTYFLSDPNIEILRAENGKEAVEKCLSDISIDLVLMDIKMPVMDGYTAAKIIRKSRPGITIIAQTAYADDLAKAKEYGCDGFISKPFDKKRLLKVLAEFI